MTKAEACLCKYVLRARHMKGYQVLRQRPVLDYIADFMCKELMLIIEVDEITHHYPDTHKNDIIGQQKLEQSGFTLLRFDDEDILTAINSETEEIENWIEKYERTVPPPLSPSKAGHGNS